MRETRALVALKQERACMSPIPIAEVGSATLGIRTCLRLGWWQARYPGPHRKGLGRRTLTSPRCLKHALAFCQRYGLRIPKALAQAEAERVMRLSAVHPDPVRIRLLEERMEECTNNWRDGTCPKCGETHYTVIRRERLLNLEARLRAIEAERDRTQGFMERFQADAAKLAVENARLTAEGARLLARLRAVEAELHAYRALGDVQWIRDRLADIRAGEANRSSDAWKPSPP